MCHECELDDENGYQHYPPDETNVLTRVNDKIMAYVDHDGDKLRMTKVKFTPDDESESIDCYVLANQLSGDDDNMIVQVRIPVDVLLEMMDQLGIKVFA